MVDSVQSENLSQRNLSTDIEDNILDTYDLPTYHFRLYMMSDSAVQQKLFGKVARTQRVVIAESGLTDVGIENVQIRSIGAISKETGIGQATNFSFELHEPFGAVLLDKISDAAKFLGVKNFSKSPYYLELSFRGRETGDSSSQEGDQGDLRELVWIWPLHFTRMSLNVGTGGSIYAINAVIFGDLAYTNQASDLQKPVSVTATTVKEFFDSFETQMNDRAATKTKSSGYQLADTYKFIIDDSILSESIVPDRLEDRQNRSGGYEFADGKMVFTFQPPTSIDRIVENVLSLAPLFQKKIKGTADKDALGDSKAGEEAITQTLYRLIADTTVGEYDEKREDYQHMYRYLIVPYEMTTIQTPSNNAANVTSEQRVESLQRKGRIKKIYNYIYTGLNDQVLDFDLTFNFNWYIALPLQAGVSTNPAAAESMATADDAQRGASEIAADGINKGRNFLAKAAGFNPISFFEDQFNQFVDTNFSGVNQTAADISSNVDSVQAQVNDAQVAANTAIGSVTSTVQSGIPAIPETIGGVVLPPNPISNTISAINQITSFTRLPRVPTVNSNTSLSGGQAQRELRELDVLLDDPTITGQKENLPLKTSLSETMSGDTNADTAQLAQSPGRTMLSAMFNQARSPIGADLLNINLEIKGDPYWLEPPPTSRENAPQSSLDRILANRGNTPTGDSAVAVPTAGELQDFTVADSATAQTYMVFRSFTPQEFDPNTGLTPAGSKSNNVLNGVYAIRQVEHKFSSGQFTQSLHGIRDPKVNLANVDLLSNLRVTDEGIANESDTPLEEITVTSLRRNSGDDGLGNTTESTQQGTANTEDDTNG